MYLTTFDQKLAEMLNSFEVNGWPVGNLILCVIAMLLAFLFCGIIGLEREIRGRSAGIRTHVLVGVGSCVIMILSIYGFPAMIGEGGRIINRDVARLAAQVVSGIGFLGAGVIMHRNSGVKGLTTAASVWLSMAIGLACGSMNFIIAALTTALVFVVLTVIRKFESKVRVSRPSIFVVGKQDKPFLNEVMLTVERYGATISRYTSELNDDGNVDIYFRLSYGANPPKTKEFLDEILKIDGVLNALSLNHGD